MSTLISEQLAKILTGVKEVFVYFDNSAISDDAQITIGKMLDIARSKKEDHEINIQKLLDRTENFNKDIQSAIDDTIMRSGIYYRAEQTKETEMICNLFKARVDTLIMMLNARI